MRTGGEVYKGIFSSLAILATLAFAATVMSSEPDGRVAFRYNWLDKVDGEAPPTKLRLTVTATVGLKDTQLRASLPGGVGLTLQATGRAPAPWPEEGLALGDLAAGQKIVIELDVAKPPRGFGIVGFVLHASSDGRSVSEGVGVPVGVPGTLPTLRNGAVEFPAAHEEPAP